jgi:hypothetical protein
MLTIAGDYSMTLAARSARTRLRRGLTGGVLSGFRENGLMAADDADPGHDFQGAAGPLPRRRRPDGLHRLRGTARARFSPDRGIQDVVAGRLRVMIGA